MDHLAIGSFAFVQILGIMTLALFVISIQQRKKENFLLLQVAGASLFILRYVLTDSYTGAILFMVALIRGLVFYYYKKKGLKPSLTILLTFLAVLGVSTIYFMAKCPQHPTPCCHGGKNLGHMAGQYGAHAQNIATGAKQHDCLQPVGAYVYRGVDGGLQFDIYYSCYVAL